MDNTIFQLEKEKLRQVLNQIQVEREYLNQAIADNTHLYSKEDYTRAYLTYIQDKKQKELEKIQSKPYFARLDFKEEKGDAEKLYIGKLSLLDKDTHKPIIIDWRSPIANLYYDGKLGEAEYKCIDGIIKGDILLKRQFIIEDGILKRYLDIDLTTNDELLQVALGQNADSRLKNIVSTIQEEQNKIIRADMFKTLIVQGVAGSGKTTIALHRIAYLIYNHENEFNPEEFMIIAPNKFFLNYISEILPDLGVENVRQCTFEDFAFEIIGKKLKISDENEKLIKIVNKENQNISTDLLIQESKLKSSIKFQQIVDEYLKVIEENFLPQEDFIVEGYTIMRYKELQYLFKEKYASHNFEARLFEIKKDLVYYLRKFSQDIINQIKSKRSKDIEELYHMCLSEDEIRNRRISLFEEKENILKLLENKPEKIAEYYIKKIKKLDCLQYYKDFISNYLSQLTMKQELKEYLINSTRENLSKNSVTYEDIAPIMYIQYKVYGTKSKIKLNHVVIDEAQDYGEFQFAVLKMILNSNSMTILRRYIARYSFL